MSNYSKRTQLIYGNHKSKLWDFSHHLVPPVTRSTAFRLESAKRGAEGFKMTGKHIFESERNPIYVYNRMGEPTNDMLNQTLAVFEGGDVCLTFSTGMAAIQGALMPFLSSGDEILSHSTIYGATYSMMTKWMHKWGIKVTFQDMSKNEPLKITPKTKIIYLESPANPTLTLLDTELICKQVAKFNPKPIVVFDNTFSTPWSQRPLEHGADLITHSLTKAISGFGSDMGGAVIGKKELMEQVYSYRTTFGSTLSSQASWNILHFGLGTLPIRFKKAQENAIEVANFLNSHPRISRVFYPGLDNYPQAEIAQRLLRDPDGNFAPGFMIYFVLKGTPEEARYKGEMMMNYIADFSYTVTLAISLGQLRTLIQHPSSMTHASYPIDEQIKVGIDAGGIRLAVGVEDPKDIIKDLEDALNNIYLDNFSI